MPAYVQHHDIETTEIVCPDCIGLLSMHLREVEPHWSMARIDFIYECSDCGAEVRQTVTRPERPHPPVARAAGHLAAASVTARQLDRPLGSLMPQALGRKS
jgi:DNA-directed RNA polymerase subunit RPC12/RpoP